MTIKWESKSRDYIWRTKSKKKRDEWMNQLNKHINCAKQDNLYNSSENIFNGASPSVSESTDTVYYVSPPPKSPKTPKTQKSPKTPKSPRTPSKSRSRSRKSRGYRSPPSKSPKSRHRSK